MQPPLPTTLAFSPLKSKVVDVFTVFKIHWGLGTGERSQLTLFKTQDTRASALISFLHHDLHKR